MANRNFDSAYVLGKGRVVLAGSFQPNGTGAPTLPKGKGWSIARSGVGTYVVTFQDGFVDYDNASADLQSATPTANWAQLGPIDVVTNKTLTIVLVNSSGTAVDITGAANTRVHFDITMVNSTVI